MNVRKIVKSHSSCLPRGSWSLVVRLEGKWLSLCITSWTWVSCFPGIVETVLLCNPGWPQSWLRPVSGSQVCTITSDKCFTSPVSKCWVRTYFHSQDKKLVLTTQEHQICLQVTHPITSLPDDNPQWPPDSTLYAACWSRNHFQKSVSTLPTSQKMPSLLQVNFSNLTYSRLAKVSIVQNIVLLRSFHSRSRSAPQSLTHTPAPKTQVLRATTHLDTGRLDT